MQNQAVPPSNPSINESEFIATATVFRSSLKAKKLAKSPSRPCYPAKNNRRNFLHAREDGQAPAARNRQAPALEAGVEHGAKGFLFRPTAQGAAKTGCLFPAVSLRVDYQFL